MLIRSLLVACTLGITSFAFSQGADPGPSPSASLTPFVVDESQAEKPTGKSTPTPKPDLNFPSNPIAPSTPKPPEANTSDEPSVPRAEPAAPQEILTRLQIFLDEHSFGPGKIDGRWGDFIEKALQRFQVAQGQQPSGQIDSALQQELHKISPVYTTYTFTDADLHWVGKDPSKPAAMAQLKKILYRSDLDYIAERYHADPDFIRKLNPGRQLDNLKNGSTVQVPNVQPFLIETIQAVPDLPPRPEFGQRIIKVDTRACMLDLVDANRVIASFPITP